MQSNNLRRVSGALATCVLFVAGPLQAGASKVDICHFDEVEGIFEPISVKANSAQNHIAQHGDQIPGDDPGTGAPVLDEDYLILSARDVLAVLG